MSRLREFSLEVNGDVAQRRAFSLQTRCVTALYERLFPRFNTQSCWKVIILCVETNPRPTYRNLLGVYEQEISADTQSFFTLINTEKKQWAFEQLQRGLEQLRQQTGWDEEPFAAAAAEADTLELRNVWRSKVVLSPSGRLKAEVWLDHDVDTCAISLVVRSRAGEELCRRVVITEEPSEWAFSQHLGSLTWPSESRVLLTSKDRERSWSIDLP